MDTSHDHESLKVCIKHNQPIILFDSQQNQELCFTCVQERKGLFSIDSIKQKKQEINQQSDTEFQQGQQQLQILLDSIQQYKQNIINGIDKILKIIIEQIENIKETKQKFQNKLEQSNQLNAFEQLNIQLKQYKENHEQVNTQIKQLLSDFQQRYININLLIEKQTTSLQIIEEKNDSNDLKSEDLQVHEMNQEIIQNIGVFQYELIEESRIKQNIPCYSFAFNKDNSLIIIGCDSDIKIYQFINGKIGKKLQVLSNHDYDVNCLYFMKNSDCFVSGSNDKSIIIWKYERNNQWVTQQILTEHKDSIHCLLMNKSEDLLISGSYAGNLKFWKKDNNNQWGCYQSIKIGSRVYALSLNEMENKLITCGIDAYIYVLEIQEDKQWSIQQEIKVDESGLRLCFTFKDQFVFQPRTKDYLEIYDYDNNSNQFKKQSQVQIQSCKDCDILFPCQFIRQLNILFVKHGNYLNIFKIKEDKNYQLIQTIDCNDYMLFGKVSDDGQYSVTWDAGSREIQVRKLKLMNE